jgi:hypothetical protein
MTLMMHAIVFLYLENVMIRNNAFIIVLHAIAIFKSLILSLYLTFTQSEWRMSLAAEL